MCTQDHEYQDNSHDVRSSVIISQLPTQMGKMEKKSMASVVDLSFIGLPSARTDLVTSSRQFQEKGLNFSTALSIAAETSAQVNCCVYSSIVK